MIRAAIYGNSVFSAALRKMIHKIYNKIIAEYGGEALDVVAYMKIFSEQNEDDEIPVISIPQAAAAIKAGEIEVLLVPRENYSGQNDYLTVFLMLGIGLDNVYFAQKLDGRIASVDAVANMFTPYYQDSYLPYLEFHTADHCNLNCAACEHYSGLVSTPVITVYEKFERDLFKLKEFVDDIGLIRILGGRTSFKQGD